MSGPAVERAQIQVPRPPEPFDALEHVLPKGSVLHRVHRESRDPRAFNPGHGAPTRFAPFRSATSSTTGADGTVPTLYAAASAEAAVCETLLHDVPLTGGILPRARYADRAETAVSILRTLRLAKLMGDGLRRLGVAPQQLTATAGDVYDETVLWAEAAHAAGFDGLAWMSARDNTAEAYVLFGDRVRTHDLEIASGGASIGPFTPGLPGHEWLIDYCTSVKVDVLME